jgi:hypothetical protein
MWLTKQRSYPEPCIEPKFRRLLVVRFLNISELKHSSAIALGNRDRVSQLLDDLWVCLDVPASLAVNGSKSLSHKSGIYASERVQCSRRVSGIDKTEMKQGSFTVVDVGDQFATFA